MEELPLRVTIIIPTDAPELRGRYSTSPPYGFLVSSRMPHAVIEAIDKARALIDPNMSRSLFIRLSSAKVAEAIVEHHHEYLRNVNDGPDRITET